MFLEAPSRHCRVPPGRRPRSLWELRPTPDPLAEIPATRVVATVATSGTKRKWRWRSCMEGSRLRTVPCRSGRCRWEEPLVRPASEKASEGPHSGRCSQTHMAPLRAYATSTQWCLSPSRIMRHDRADAKWFVPMWGGAGATARRGNCSKSPVHNGFRTCRRPGLATGIARPSHPLISSHVFANRPSHCDNHRRD